MKKILGILVFFTSVIIAGCQPANMTSVMSHSNVSGTNVQTRCEYLDMRNNADMETVFAKYDGWILIYVSEYTSDKRFGTSGVVCFERAK